MWDFSSNATIFVQFCDSNNDFWQKFPKREFLLGDPEEHHEEHLLIKPMFVVDYSVVILALDPLSSNAIWFSLHVTVGERNTTKHRSVVVGMVHIFVASADSSVTTCKCYAPFLTCCCVVNTKRQYYCSTHRQGRTPDLQQLLLL